MLKPLENRPIHPRMPRISFLALTILWAFIVAAMPAAQAQTFSVIYAFSGGLDGATPYAGLTMDKAGNFYGTAFAGGSRSLGTVYRLKRAGSSWIADGLYSFAGGANDGAQPLARVIFGPDGSLYGTASIGGRGQFCGLGCGVVFKLQPPLTFCHSVSCPWTETVLYQFAGIPDGGLPTGEFLFDEAGNLYGTTVLGGTGGGTLYELIRSGDSWTEKTISNVTGLLGFEPYGGIISDSAGNLYGTTQEGGEYNAGSVFQFQHSGLSWTGMVLYTFQHSNDGRDPSAGLIFDKLGNLYGASSDGGAGGGGVIFELSPSGGDWTYTLLYGLTGTRDYRCPNPNNQYAGPGPWASLAMDEAGNLYGTTLCDGANHLGNIFKLTPSGGGWVYTSLHDFTGGNDGAYPLSNVLMDAGGSLYGTASAGGSKGHGVVWEITP